MPQSTISTIADNNLTVFQNGLPFDADGKMLFWEPTLLQALDSI